MATGYIIMDFLGYTIDGIYIVVFHTLLVMGLTIAEPFSSGLAYFVGRQFTNIFAVNIKSKTFNKAQRRMSAFGNPTYEENGVKYFYTETIHMLGVAILTIMACGLTIYFFGI